MFEDFESFEDFEKYLIKKGKETDLLSSAKKLNESAYKDYLLYNNVGVKNIDDLAQHKYNLVKTVFDDFIGDSASFYYYANLVRYENTTKFIPAGSDIEDFVVFLYKTKRGLSYYIPDEMKELIIKYLDRSIHN